MFRLTPTVRLILIINVLVYLVPMFTGSKEFVDNVLGLHHIDSQYFGPWQWLTHMFVHGGFNHILFNMLGLAVFGPMIEYVWGEKRFVFFYLFCGLGAGLLYSIWNYYEFQQQYLAYQAFLDAPSIGGAEQYFLKFYPNLKGRMSMYLMDFEANGLNSTGYQYVKNTMQLLTESNLDKPMVGASGALYGVLAAFGLLFPNMQLMLLFPPIPIKAKYVVLIYAVIAVYSAFSNDPTDNTAHLAHIGGLLFGALMVWYWRNDTKRFS